MPASKFTADRVAEVLRARRLGASGLTSARCGGIDEKTLRNWLDRGRDAPEGSKYRQFFEEFEAATAVPNVRALEIVHQAMLDKPDLAWKFLERREPGFAPQPPNTPAAHPVLIGLSLGHETAASGELVEGTVIDVTQESSGPRRLPARTGSSTGKAS